MTTETLTCPYCNASLSIQSGLSADQRVVCPRCGDAFPLRPADAFTGHPAPSVPALADTAITDRPTAAGATASRPELSLRSRRSNTLIAGLVLGVMLLMAGGGLVFMLMTQQQRRAYDTSRPPRRPGKQLGVPEPEVPPPVAAVAPDKLAALGYVPSGVNFLLAVRFPELLASPIGAQMLRDPIKFGDQDFRLQNLAPWLGFALEDIDHLVLAAHIDRAMPPPFFAVLRTVAPYDEEQIRQRLQCTRVANAGKKKLYAFRMPRQEIQPKAWFADERTVVLALFADQLEPLPSQPVEDLQQLPEELRTLLKKRSEPASPLWIAGHSSDWNRTSAAIFVNRMKKQDLDRLASLQTFGIWIVPDKSLVVNGAFSCKDEAGARGLENYVRALRGLDANCKMALDGPWLSLQLQTGPDFLAQLLKR